MRNIVTLVCIFLATSVIAQTATKYPLLEHFTNTKCPICANRNPGFHNLWMMYENDVHHIAFHPKYPYSDCQFYQANKQGNQSRAEYYGINGTPTVYLDGVEGSGTNLVEESAIQNSIAQQSYFEIAVLEVDMGNTTDVTVKVTTRGNVPSGTNYTMYIALAEAFVDYNAPNGEDMHYNVFREFLTPNNGITFNPPANGMTDTYTYSYTIDGNWNPDEIYAIAYIQNDDSKQIENSGTANSTTTANEDYIQKVNINIYPNPSSGNIYIDNKVENVEVYDLNGRLLSNLSPQTTVPSIDLSALDEGVYFLNLTLTDGSQAVKKVFIQK